MKCYCGNKLYQSSSIQITCLCGRKWEDKGNGFSQIIDPVSRWWTYVSGIGFVWLEQKPYNLMEIVI